MTMQVIRRNICLSTPINGFVCQLASICAVLNKTHLNNASYLCKYNLSTKNKFMLAKGINITNDQPWPNNIQNPINLGLKSRDLRVRKREENINLNTNSFSVRLECNTLLQLKCQISFMWQRGIKPTRTQNGAEIFFYNTINIKVTQTIEDNYG